MNRPASLSLLAVALASCSGIDAAPPDPRAARAGAAFDALVAEGYAGSALLACNADVVFTRHDGAPAGDRTSYWLASLSKQFTAALILKLEEEGALSLDDPIARHLPDVPADKAAITIHQLLSHTSGLGQTYVAEGVVERDEAARRILAQDLVAAPGAEFRYGNDSYVLAAIIAETAGGDRFERLLKDKILKPAGIADAALWPDEASDDVAAPRMTSWFDPSMRVENWGFKGPSGLRMSVRDLHVWALALRSGAVLSDAGATTLFGPHVRVNDTLDAGYTWFWERAGDGPDALWTRGQEAAGFNAVLYTYPGTGWIIAAATHAGPPETGDGPVTGWSRRARDVLVDAFVADGAEDCPA